LNKSRNKTRRTKEDNNIDDPDKTKATTRKVASDSDSDFDNSDVEDDNLDDN
jgi:hypothetical protein